MSGHVVAVTPAGDHRVIPWPDHPGDQLDTLRSIVGGDIEIAAASERIVLWCHAEGWTADPQPNPTANTLAAVIAPHVEHHIAGTVAITERRGEHTLPIGVLDPA